MNREALNHVLKMLKHLATVEPLWDMGSQESDQKSGCQRRSMNEVASSGSIESDKRVIGRRVNRVY